MPGTLASLEVRCPITSSDSNPLRLSLHLDGQIPLAGLLNPRMSQAGPHALAHALGDGYLYAHNRLYRRIREATVEIGCSFSCEPDREWYDYQVFPLLLLDQIVAKRVIPYVDNCTTLQNLSSRHPGIGLTPRFLLDSIRRNYVLHESAHCLADAFLSESGLLDPPPRGDGDTALVLKDIMGESFANTCESIASCLCTGPTERFFYSLNSYQAFDPELTERISGAIRSIGLAATFLLGLMCFFRLNLLSEPLDAESGARLVGLASGGIQAGQRDDIVAMVRTCFLLNRRFVAEGSLHYFMMRGLSKAFVALCEEDADSLLREDAILASLVRLAEFAASADDAVVDKESSYSR